MAASPPMPVLRQQDAPTEPNGPSPHDAAIARVRIGDKWVGPGEPVYVIGEIGINHNGDLDNAQRLIAAAAAAGVDAVKFQKRTPALCVPKDQWLVERDTPWGRMTYIDYRSRVELSTDDYAAIDRQCEALGVDWFLSCWDEPSVDFSEHFAPPCYKAASASLTDLGLLQRMQRTGRPLMISTGMSTLEEIDQALDALNHDQLLIAHTNSTYPCPPDILNLRMIQTLIQRFPCCPVGYSGHEAGTAPSLAAVALGATFVERHITLDKRLWGSDQAASLEPQELKALVDGIRTVEVALGDGVKRLYASELAAQRKLRRVRAGGQPTGLPQ